LVLLRRGDASGLAAVCGALGLGGVGAELQAALLALGAWRAGMCVPTSFRSGQ
jgi:hypothetical protein